MLSSHTGLESLVRIAHHASVELSKLVLPLMWHEARTKGSR